MKNITERPLIEQVEFQVSNVRGWINSNNYESALIKAEYLKEAVEGLIKELKDKTKGIE